MRRMTWLGGLVALALAWLAPAPSASADLLISNLPGNDGTQTAGIDTLRCKGMGFTMPGGLGYYLDSATLRLRTYSANTIPVIQIWSDSGGVPGAPLITLDNPVFNPSGIANYDFTPGVTFTLEADTAYWLVASGAAGGTAYDWMASIPAQTPTGLATHSGCMWGTTGVPPNLQSSILVSYELHGTPVPAPAAGLVLAGLGGLGLRRRRRG